MPKLFALVVTPASLLVAAITYSPAMAESGKVLSQPNGRFVFGQISEARRDQFMLDTATGQVWQVTCLQVAQKKKGKKDSDTGVGINDCISSGLMPFPYVTGESNNKYQFSLTPGLAQPK